MRSWFGAACVAVALASLCTACGSRTALRVGRALPVDAGVPPDGDTDAAVDAGPPSIEVSCGFGEVFTAPRVPLALAPDVTELDDRTYTYFWRLVEGPSGVTSSLAPSDLRRTTFTAQGLGEFVVEFIARDSRGGFAMCRYSIGVITEVPGAMCPAGELRAVAGDSLEVVGGGFDAEGPVTFLWTVIESPPGSGPRLMPRDTAATRFSSDAPGNYRLELRVTDLDGASDSCVARIRVIAPPRLECPSSPVRARTRQPVRLAVEVSDDTPGVVVSWSIRSRPAESVASIVPATGESVSLTPDRAGTYDVRVDAVDRDGLSATCEFEVIAVPTPPDAVCPESITTTPLSTVILEGRGVDDGIIVAFAWSIDAAPLGSSASPPTPGDVAVARFTPDIVGEFRLALEVTDDDGNLGRCTTLVRAIGQEGLRIEMFWNPPDRSCDTTPSADCDSSDVDLHLLRPGDERWGDDDGDCHYANCAGVRLDWGGPGPDDDPRLDLDDVEGFGPENINVDSPARGVYRVGAHYFGNERDRSPALVTARIYCGETSAAPVATFGPATLRANGFNVDGNDFWRIADVEILADGRCRVTDLAAGGRPNIVTYGVAQAVR